MGQPSALIFTPEDKANGVPERELSDAIRDGRVADVRWHQRKDGTLFWADGVLQRLDGKAGAFDGFAKVLRDATRQHEAEQRYRTLSILLTQVFASLRCCSTDRTRR
jgi:PAS domain S-box-containing protein